MAIKYQAKNIDSLCVVIQLEYRYDYNIKLEQRRGDFGVKTTYRAHKKRSDAFKNTCDKLKI